MVEEDRDPALSYENSPRAGFRNRGVSKTSARILNASFTRTSPGRGLWKGHFIGEGYVQLYLDLLRDEDLIESRSMGSTEVSLEEGPISFSFESPLPPASALRHKKLSWKIRAQIAD